MRNYRDGSSQINLTDKQLKTHTLGKVSLEKTQLSPIGQNILLEELPPPRNSQKKIMVVAFSLIVFLIWSTLAPVQTIVTAAGQIIPVGFTKIIQHLEGGIVKELFVKDGDVVKKGDVLLTLDDVSVRSELDQARMKQKGLTLQQERLLSFVESRKPKFNKDQDPAIDHLRKTQNDIYKAQVKSLEDQLQILQKQLGQKKSTLQSQQARVQDLENQQKFVTEKRDLHKSLQEKQLNPRTTYLDAEENLARLTTELNAEKNQLKETSEAISELEARIVEIKTRTTHEALKEMGEVAKEITLLDNEILKLNDRLTRTKITSPTSGIVKGLTVTTLRSVIQPGGEIMQIVPQSGLEAEVNINPQDLGNVKVGQKVKIKVSAYDYARFGGIEGEIHSISATTFKDQEGRPFYKALITLNKSYVGQNRKSNILSPGMTVQADIDTGEQTFFQYLFLPVTKAMQSAFTER